MDIGARIRSLLPRTVRLVALLLFTCVCATHLSAQNALLGDQTIESNLDSDSVGTAEAFPATANASGQVGSINVFLDESSASTKIYAGIYNDSGGKPGTLLTQGETTQLLPGTWNSVSLAAATISSGTPYWIAILGTTGGKPYFYDRSTSSCHSQTSSQSSLTSLPGTWSTGKTWNTCYLSAYAVSGTYPASVMIGDQAIETSVDKNPAGQAEAFPANANATGSVATIALYLDQTSGSGPVYVGLYADNNGHPGTLLGQGNTATPAPGTWNQISVTPTNLTAGQRYWIAVLGTKATSPYFRDRQTTACHSQTSSQSTLTSLPATWSAGSSWNTCYISAYGLAAAGSPILTVSPSSLSFAAIQAGANPAAANLSVTNAGSGVLNFTVSSDSSWLTASPTTGTAPQTIQVAAATGSLAPGTYTGHVTVTAAGVQGSPAVSTVTFTIAQFIPPSIAASTSPSPNANGWNKSAVTVSFTCTAGSYAIQTCPAPIQVSTQGANQVISGTVVDAKGNTNTAKVTLNIDLTAPVVSITSPTNGASFTSSPAAVSGSESDSLSGISTVTCNAALAALQSGSYSCSVPLIAGGNTISVQATDLAGNTASQSISTSLIVPATIVSFNPPSTSIGSLVTVQGSGFAQTGFPPEVTLNQEGGGSIVAPISSAAAGSLSFVIPAGAASGPITITVDGFTVTSSNSLTIVGSSSFALAAVPGSATLLPGQTTTVQVSLTSGNGFSQLAALSLAGLPIGVTASFQPPQITSGQFSTVTFAAPASQTASSTSLTISGSAIVQGIQQTQTTPVSLIVQPPAGSATFVGQVAVTGSSNTPLVGVTVSFTGTNYTGAQTGCTGSSTTDAAGNFILNGSTSCTGSQMIQYDPSTVTSPAGKYSGVTLSYVITPNQVTTPGIIVHLPNVSNAETFTVSQSSSSDQTFVSQSIPGLSITVYAGTAFSLANGSQPNPFPLSVVEIPYSQIPDYMPPNPTEDPVFAMSIEPFNSSASQPIAVSYPNRKGTPPGTAMPLTSLNPTMGMMVNYGTGTVSSDGSQVIPDPDPSNPGHLYGISHFDWHFPLPPPGNGPNPCPDCNVPDYGDPVDPASGILEINKADLSFGGSRGQIAITRIYREMSISSNPDTMFGQGTSTGYSYFLNTTYVSTVGTSGMIYLLMPDGNQYVFSQQTNGTYINSSIPSLNGSVISSPSNGIYNLRWKDGTVMVFQANLTPFPVGYLTSIIDSNGNAITITRNLFTSPPQITKITDPLGRSLTINYGSYCSSISDPLGRTVRYTYSPQGKLATVTDAAGGTTSYGYDGQNRLITLTDPRGNTYQNTYDQNGRVIEQQAPDGGITAFAYTQLNPLTPSSPVIATTVTDPFGNTTAYNFNATGFMTSMTDALGETTVYTLNAANQVQSTTDPIGRTTAYTYDATGNTASITRLSGTSGAVTATFTYDPSFNKMTQSVDPLGHTTAYTYDGNNGNLLAVITPAQEQTSYTYDSFGERLSFKDPVGNTTSFAYTNGDLISTTDPLGRVTTRANDSVSRPISFTNPLGQTMQYQYDNLDRVVQITDAAGKRTALDYDASGNFVSFADPNQNVTTFSYDSRNRLAGHSDPLGHSDSYQYDKNGNLLQYKDRRGKLASYSYDAVNRKIAANFGPGESTMSFVYDSAGRLIEADDSLAGVVSRNYDGLDRLTLETTQQGSISYGYDPASRRTSMQASGQSAVTYTYDADDRLTKLTQGSSSGLFAYDGDWRRASLTLPNGVIETYSYDAASELSSINYQSGSTSIGTLTYTYDSAGRRNSVGGSFAQTTIPAAVSSATYNADNQQTQWNAGTRTYDANGNLLSDGTNTYTWNSRNQLVSVTGPGSATFQYDAFGRRAGKSVSGTATGYLYDGLNAVQELTAGMPTANLLLGTKPDETLQRTDASGTATFLRDALGSTVALTASNGSILAQYTYDPFGNTTQTGSSTNPSQYTGRENDGTGLYYYRARYYQPSASRFISEDPTGIKGGANFYAYVSNSPLNYIDPMGTGLTSVDAAMEQAIARGDVAEVQALLEATGDELTPGMRQAAQIAVDNGSTTEGGAKSAAELAEHLKNTANADDLIAELEEDLENAPQKAKQAIEEEIEELKQSTKGHLKEIKQKWGLCKKFLGF